MAVVKNFLFGETNSDHSISRLVDYRSAKADFFLIGFSYGKNEFPDGSKILTSSITNVDVNKITTNSGSIYLVEEIHPDYKDFLDSIDKKIPILYDWSINGSLKTGYYITGIISLDEEETEDTFEIIHQEGNFLMLKKSENENFKVFIDWFSTNHSLAAAFKLFNGQLEGTDLNLLEDFVEFCGENQTKPVLFL